MFKYIFLFLVLFAVAVVLTPEARGARGSYGCAGQGAGCDGSYAGCAGSAGCSGSHGSGCSGDAAGCSGASRGLFRGRGPLRRFLFGK